MTDTRMLIVAGYQDVDLAEREFEALAAKVASKELRSDGMILVSRGGISSRSAPAQSLGMRSGLASTWTQVLGPRGM